MVSACPTHSEWLLHRVSKLTWTTIHRLIYSPNQSICNYTSREPALRLICPSLRRIYIYIGNRYTSRRGCLKMHERDSLPPSPRQLPLLPTHLIPRSVEALARQWDIAPHARAIQTSVRPRLHIYRASPELGLARLKFLAACPKREMCGLYDEQACAIHRANTYYSRVCMYVCVGKPCGIFHDFESEALIVYASVSGKMREAPFSPPVLFQWSFERTSLSVVQALPYITSYINSSGFGNTFLGTVKVRCIAMFEMVIYIEKHWEQGWLGI